MEFSTTATPATRLREPPDATGMRCARFASPTTATCRSGRHDMGSYSGSSDWDDLPSSTDSATFAPKPVVQQKDADDEPLSVTPQGDKKPLDLILAFDTTGSRRPWIQNV